MYRTSPSSRTGEGIRNGSRQGEQAGQRYEEGQATKVVRQFESFNFI